jgi:hypothetical protein
VNDAGTTNTGITITGVTTLKGGGSVVFSDVANSHNYIQDNGSPETFDNLDNTLSGAGQIRGQLAFTNEVNGVLLADSTGGNSFVVVTSSFTNDGTLRATNGAELDVQVDGNHNFANLTADALHPGGDVLTGGTYDVVDPVGGGASQIVFYNPGVLPITTLDADVILSGASSSLSTVFDQFSPRVSLQTSLVDIGTAGALNLFYGFNSGTAANFSDPNAIEVAGALNLNGASFTAAQITLDATGTVTGSGILTARGGSIVDNGVITADPAYGPLATSLDVVGNVTGSGTFDIAPGATLELSGSSDVPVFFSGSLTGPGGTLKLDVPSTGPITVVNPNDTVIAQPGGDKWINAIANYTLPANIDALFLYAGTQGTGNSDASGDALYALNGSAAQTLIGNSANDTFVVDSSSDVVVPKAGSHDVVYAAASYALPTGVDVLILEAGTQAVGNSDATGDALYAANPNQVATLTGNSANDTFVVYNSADVVVPKAGSHDVVYSAASYTLPTGVDSLILEAGTQAVGNSDAAGDALYAANAGVVQTLIGNSANDTFVVYNSADVVVPKAGSHDLVYSAVNYTLPTGVDVLFLEAGTQAIGNSDAAGDTLYAADAGIAQTLTGHSHNDTFVAYNAGDTVIGQASSTDTLYAAVNFTLPTNVDTLFLEGSGATHGAGNGDAVDALFGNAGVASTLVAGNGGDTLYVTGTAGTILTGGTGHDTFAFPNVMGHDEVTNFGTPEDTLQFNATLFSNFTAAMNHASQSGANTVFTIDANDTVTLDNVTKTSLTAGNFHFS